MSNRTAYFNRQIEQEEQVLYDHLLSLVQTELPDQLVQRFQKLFIEGVGYPDSAVVAALDRIAASKSADQEFQYVLNRCCHILINRWQARSQLQSAIPDLVAVFQSEPSRQVRDYTRGRSIKRLQELVQGFVQTEQYLTLRRLASVVAEKEANYTSTTPVGSFIHRYPYLYEHCLLTEQSSYEHKQTIRDLQTKAQQQYELDLSKYVTYQVRRAQIARSGSVELANRLIQPSKNPTLLSDRELCVALKYFVGRSHGTGTFRDMAQRFISHANQTQTFKEVKDSLYDYITASVDSEYGKRQFNQQLYKQLQQTLPESDGHRPTDFLMVRTCSQILNLLVVESAQKPQHYLFVDLIANLGPTLITGLLLKIVLICRKVKPYLEKRFAILFNHYESCQQDAVQWLIQALENMNVALSTNFSTMDLSIVNQLNYSGS